MIFGRLVRFPNVGLSHLHKPFPCPKDNWPFLFRQKMVTQTWVSNPRHKPNGFARCIVILGIFYMNTDELTPEKIAEIVQRLLNENATPNLTLHLVKSGIHQDGDWISIPVVPDPVPARRFAFYETLAIVEQKMQTEMNRTVLLVPVSAESAQEAEAKAARANPVPVSA